MTVTVEIPMTLPSASNLREHWAVKAKRVKAQRVAAWAAMHSACVFNKVPLARGSGGVWIPAQPLAVTLTRVAPRALDDDNLRGAFKAVRDEVAAYFGVDDNDSRIEWRYAQERGKPARVRIAFDVASASPFGPDTPATGAHAMKATS